MHILRDHVLHLLYAVPSRPVCYQLHIGDRNDLHRYSNIRYLWSCYGDCTATFHSMDIADLCDKHGGSPTVGGIYGDSRTNKNCCEPCASVRSSLLFQYKCPTMDKTGSTQTSEQQTPSSP